MCLFFHDSSFYGLISPVVAPEPETTVYFSLESRGSMSHRDAARLTSRTWKRRFPPVRSSARAEGTASQTMEALNAMTAADAADAFVKCCGSPEFGRRMAAARPFSSFDDVLAASRKVWYDCPVAEWELAFKAHPRIGDVSKLKEKFASTASWCEGEQSAAQASMDDATINELAEWNERYEEKFGRVFLICASGKPAHVILAALKERYPNEQDVELRNAADEQQKITEIRLEKLRADLTAKL